MDLFSHYHIRLKISHCLRCFEAFTALKRTVGQVFSLILIFQAESWLISGKLKFILYVCRSFSVSFWLFRLAVLSRLFLQWEPHNPIRVWTHYWSQQISIPDWDQSLRLAVQQLIFCCSKHRVGWGLSKTATMLYFLPSPICYFSSCLDTIHSVLYKG